MAALMAFRIAHDEGVLQPHYSTVVHFAVSFETALRHLISPRANNHTEPHFYMAFS
jgi:hypothetical protein